MKKIICTALLTLFMSWMIIGMASCTGVKHLTKTIDKAFAKKDSTGKNDSVIVSKDSSKFNSEIVIEYDSTKFAEKLMEGSDIDWDPFYPPQEFDSIMSRISAPTGSIKRITIRTNVQLHKSDSSVFHSTASVKAQTKTIAVNKVVEKKRTFYWWLLLLIIPAAYYIYKKYFSKIKI